MIADSLRFRIIGQGPVALSLQLFALRAGVPFDAIETDPAPDPGLPDKPELAARTLALSLGSWQLLARIIDLPPACAIREVEVSLQGHSGRTRITSAEMRVPALGYVTRYSSLLQALLQARGALDDTALALRGVTDLKLLDSQSPSVVIHAEGNPGEEIDTREFAQHAVLAELHCPGMPAHCAIERFTRNGPMAILPLPDPAKFSLVWCCTPDQALARLTMNDTEFVDELRVQLGPRLRGAGLIGTRIQAPLQRRQRKQTVCGNEIWIGNAAQWLHPVAGQGLNLGLRDSFELAQWLGPLATRFRASNRSSLVQVLQQYDRSRLTDRRSTVRVTDTLASVFTETWMAPAQSLALSLLDLTPTLRGTFARRLMFGKRQAEFSNFE